MDLECNIRRAAWLLALIMTMLLVACERPDPMAAETVAPTPTPAPTETPLPTPTALPTATPFVAPTPEAPQVFVFILPSQFGAAENQEGQGTPAADQETAAPSPTVAYPDNHVLGWVWTSSLTLDGNRMEVTPYGVTMYDGPSSDGQEVGLVLGLSSVIVAGQGRCGYTPILVRQEDMLTMAMPQPAVEAPEPLSAQGDQVPESEERPGTTSGWAYTSELTTTGQTALSGPFGISLRAEPCRYAENLGFVPTEIEMFVIGPPVGEYTPVRVDDRYLQPAIEFGPPLLGQLPTRLPDTVTTPAP